MEWLTSLIAAAWKKPISERLTIWEHVQMHGALSEHEKSNAK